MRALIIFLLTFSLISCDKGLSPDLADPETGFGGKITFTGTWDPEITQTHIVAFKDPLLTESDFNVFNLIFVSVLIPWSSVTYDYSTNDESSLLSIIEPGDISYIAVAQSLKDTITLNREDWIVVGLYYSKEDSTNPGLLTIPEATFVDNINVLCDFDNPPPQPPGGVFSE